ncbi:MAG: DUF423 domain-containing protein [Gammaproteobacteria bacterium]|jgi:uncharacterized membrane protein YgdD (TMEM256/DUF423 family)
MIAVLLGAFAAHGLKSKLSEQLLVTFQTGVQYHFYHALGLIIIGLIASQVSSYGIRLSGWLMLSGIFLFSGSLYLLAITGIRQLGMITPIGGVCFILAWTVLAITVFKQ